MPDLNFEILSAEIKPACALPTLAFKLKLSNAVEGEVVYAAALRCQVMIEAVRRQYDEAAQERLLEIFGEKYRWSETLGTLLWTFITVPVPRFTGETILEVPITCHEDQAIAAGKYFYSVRDGDIPLAFLFSGTLFYKGEGEKIQVSQVPWEKEAEFALPADTWHHMMKSYFPDGRWLRLSEEAFDKLYRYKAENSFPTLEKCMEAIIDKATEASHSQKEKV